MYIALLDLLSLLIELAPHIIATRSLHVLRTTVNFSIMWCRAALKGETQFTGTHEIEEEKEI